MSEPVTTVIVMEKTSGLSIRNEWSSTYLKLRIQYSVQK